ncbi:LysR family transcriptional regulator [Brenneria rubrifaciens]|nr:LysR family transcriptional regulator [Brenneria rubrifaciens]
MISLDIDAVRVFVKIAESKSFTRAASELGSTQGALSVKLKRLEDRLGQKLIERTPRQVRLSVFGRSFIESAQDLLNSHERAILSLTTTVDRKFKLGISCYVMGPEVPEIFAKLRSLNPSQLIEVKVDSSHVLMHEFGNDQLDAVIVRNDDDRRDGLVLCPERFGWFATPDFALFPSQPLQLASLSPECGIRDQATRLLRQSGIDFQEVFVGVGVPAVIAAISSGIAVGVLPYRLAPPHLNEVSEKFALPTLPPLDIVLHSALSDQKSRATIQAIAKVYKNYHQKSCGI